MSRIKGGTRVDESVLINTQAFKAAVLIPVYNHEAAITHTLESLVAYECHILLVDDGSNNECQLVLERLCEQYSDSVSLLRLEQNRGKGGAVKEGLMKLLMDGYSHAVQIDADGQHDDSDLPIFLDMGKKYPSDLISGYPIYDESVPKLRYYSRYLTSIWVWINTLSFDISDSMCGFRIYPLHEVVTILEQEKCGDRMDFDIEIMVRWLWRGGKVRGIATKVSYPTDGVSHFNTLHDNVLISWMHTRLFFGMLRRLPLLLWRKING